MTAGERLKRLRLQHGYTLGDVALMIRSTKQNIWKYENGVIINIPLEKIEKLAVLFNVKPAYITGWGDDGVPEAENTMPLPGFKSLPMVGSIACGEPGLAVETSRETVEAPDWLNADFALRCRGDSMINARIFDGDVVYIRRQPTVESGEIAAVLLGEEATLKRVRKYSDRIVLEPANPMYEPLVFSGAEADKLLILGKAVAFVSSL
ncbi:MAG: helix-turn-helix domain-containing protein [Oscillospiraceae bacterium]|nr:helix-turn-helix domain-containing protein [Oscillospiraceae bacterium]